MARPELEERFIRFVAAYRERARRLAWRMVGGDEAAADDVTQDALLKAYRGLDRFRDEAALETWFFRILVRQAQSYRRWRAVRDLWGGKAGHAGHEGPDPAYEDRRDPVLQQRIADGLAALTPSQRDAFVLVHLEGFSVREAAKLMRKAEGTVKSHLHRALRSLRAELADLATEAEE